MHLPLYKIEISGIIIIVRCASVAQSVEQGTENPRVIGSIPIGGTSQETQQGFQYAAVAHLVERHLAKVEVASSSLVGRSIMEQQSLFQYGPVAQLVRAPACHAGGRRFEPDPGRFVGMSDICLAVLQVRPPQQILKFLLFPTRSCFVSFRGDPEIRENRSGGCEGKRTEYAAVAHLVERHLAKVEVASSSLVGRSNGAAAVAPNMVTWPSGKARVCKTLIHQFKSGRHLQKIPGC